MSWWNFAKAVLRREHSLAPTTWLALIATVIYTISPIDFIPDFLLPLGIVDDLGMWAVFLALATREKSRWDQEHQPDTVYSERLD